MAYVNIFLNDLTLQFLKNTGLQNEATIPHFFNQIFVQK